LDELVEKISENPGINNVIDRISQLLCKVLVPIVAALDTDTLMVISESEPFSSLISEALNRHFDQRLIGHEAHGIRWLARGDLSNSNCRGAAALLIQEVFRHGGETSDLSA
jgi:predicted NBD/HSP70 family sugar kinase